MPNTAPSWLPTSSPGLPGSFSPQKIHWNLCFFFLLSPLSAQSGWKQEQSHSLHQNVPPYEYFLSGPSFCNIFFYFFLLSTGDLLYLALFYIKCESLLIKRRGKSPSVPFSSKQIGAFLFRGASRCTLGLDSWSEPKTCEQQDELHTTTCHSPLAPIPQTFKPPIHKKNQPKKAQTLIKNIINKN